jgi:hypothetical protein
MHGFLTMLHQILCQVTRLSRVFLVVQRLSEGDCIVRSGNLTNSAVETVLEQIWKTLENACVLKNDRICKP